MPVVEISTAMDDRLSRLAAWYEMSVEDLVDLLLSEAVIELEVKTHG